MLVDQTIKDLPSHFKPYPHRFKVKVSPFKVKDVEALSSLTDPVDQIEYLLKGIRLERRAGIVVDPRELALMDFFYIGVVRMIVSGFEELKLRAMCPEGHVHSYLVKLASMDFEELAVDVPIFVELEDPKVSELKLMPDTVGRLIEAREAGLLDDPNPVQMLSLVLYSYKDGKGNEHDLSVKEAVDLLENLPASVLDPLDSLAYGLTARVKPIRLTCKTCGGEFETAPAGDLLSMVKPFRSPERPSGIKVRYGDQQAG